MENYDDDESDEKSETENELISEEVNGYSCYYLDKKFDDNDTRSNNVMVFDKSDFLENKNKITYTFKIKNNGKENWPDDVFLKCLNNNCDIYFLSTKQKEIIIDGDNQWYEFKVNIKFKNYNKIEKKMHKLKGYLESDKIGRIGNKKIFCYCGIYIY
jgi:hypothetical protein